MSERAEGFWWVRSGTRDEWTVIKLCSNGYVLWPGWSPPAHEPQADARLLEHLDFEWGPYIGETPGDMVRSVAKRLADERRLLETDPGLRHRHDWVAGQWKPSE